MEKNMEIWEKFREVPAEAQRPITAGRLKGMTDINPMWRLKCLTEQYGACGFGWYTEIVERWVENTGTEDITANVMLNLYVKDGEDWSMPIQGVGGSALVSIQKGKPYTNDECFKMAETDAISVACKKLGIGANIYWNKDNTKYNDSKRDNVAAENELDDQIENLAKQMISPTHVKTLCTEAGNIGISTVVICKEYGVNDVNELTEAQYGDCLNKIAQEKKKRGA